jgi:small GTP-binding protein
MGEFHDGKRVFKIAVLGSGSDKTLLTLRYTRETFDADYIPTIQDYFQKDLTFKGVEYELRIIDTSGDIEMSGITAIGIKDADAHVICYPVKSQVCFREVDKYHEKVKDLAANANHIVLAATSCEEENRAVTEQEGREKAAAWGCPFFETSARDDINVAAVFEAALELLLASEPAKPGAAVPAAHEGKAAKASKSHKKCNVA